MIQNNCVIHIKYNIDGFSLKFQDDFTQIERPCCLSKYSCKSTVESTYTFQLILHMRTVWFNVDLK